MTSQSRIGLLGACLIGSSLVAGCKDPQTQAQAVPRPMPPVVRTWVQPMPPAGATVAVSQPRPNAAPQTSDVVLAKGTEDVVPAKGTEDVVLAKGTETTAAKAPAHRGEDPPLRKSFADITAHPSFGHAPDYAWLSGEVEYSRISKGWRLRYASVDEEDPYGGSVTLTEHPLLHGLKDGQLVRVQGRLSNPTLKCAATPYLIDSLQPIATPEADAPRQE